MPQEIRLGIDMCQGTNANRAVTLLAAKLRAPATVVTLCTPRALSSRPTPTDPAERETEEEWRDPENASSAMPIQGVLPNLCMLFSATAPTRKS